MSILQIPICDFKQIQQFLVLPWEKLDFKLDFSASSSPHCTKMYPMALMFLAPLSVV